MLALLQTACQSFMEQDQLFWILAGLTDVSCEAGNNRRFQSAARTFNNVGIACSEVNRLLRGVNGNLAGKVELLFPNSGPFRPNIDRLSVLPVDQLIPIGIRCANRERIKMRADIWFGEVGSPSETISEVKALHDWTKPEFYGHGKHGVADDAEKLRRIRIEPFKGHLFQVVFFLQFPKYSYGSGYTSYCKKWEDCREKALYIRGIDAQYELLRKHLTEKPAWPSDDAPKITPLASPDKRICVSIEAWMKPPFFKPDDQSWRFKANEQLAGAAVGCAIWKY